MSEHKSDLIQLDTGKDKKWYGQQVGVNSDVPLMDEGKGSPYIIRQFEFAFDPSMLQKIHDKKIPIPTRQELFDSNWNQIRTTLWGDGLVAIKEKEFPPHVIVGKKKYKIILTCMPRFGTLVAERPNTLQQLAKPKSLT